MISNGHGRPLSFFLSPSQMSDAKGALVFLAQLPPAKRLLSDKGYNADGCGTNAKPRACASASWAAEIDCTQPGTTVGSTRSAAASGTFSLALRTGAPSPCATRVAATSSSRRSLCRRHHLLAAVVSPGSESSAECIALHVRTPAASRSCSTPLSEFAVDLRCQYQLAEQRESGAGA